MDAAWRTAPPFDLRAVVFFYTDEPNTLSPIDGTWDRKSAAVSEYRAQFSAEELPQLVTTLDAKAAQVARIGVGAGRLPAGTARAEALKVIIGCGRTLDGRLLLLDGLAMEWRSISVPRDPGCAGRGVAPADSAAGRLCAGLSRP